MSLVGKKNHKINYKILVVILCIISNIYTYAQSETNEETQKNVQKAASNISEAGTQNLFKKYTIQKIIINGNKNISKDVILTKLPFKEGGIYSKNLSRDAILHTYSLGYFKQIKIEKEVVDKDTVDIYITVDEAPLLEKVEFVGNKAIRRKKFIEKLHLDKIETFDDSKLEQTIKEIEAIYREEGFYSAQVDGEIVPNKENPDKVTAIFNIVEDVKSKVIKIIIKGNEKIQQRKIKQILLTKENWVLGMITGAGKYLPDVVEMDKRRIERFYQNNGYLLAKVTNVEVEFSENQKYITLTYDIQEGNQFTVGKVSAQEDDIFLEKDLLPHILIEENKPYNAEKVAISIERLKALWGNKGYINADVYPQLYPDETTNIVDINFFVERGDPVYVNRIDITGNKITNDKVIRHAIDIEEGDLLTSKELAGAENDVSRLGFFEHGGANWKIHRLNDELVDLEMHVQEAKTGHAALNLSYGSKENSDKRAVRIGATLEKRNFMGEGFDVGGQTQIQLAKHGSQSFEGHISDPHLFDTDILGLLSGYHRRQDFDEWYHVNTSPKIEETGGLTRFGFLADSIDKDLTAEFEVGWEYLNTNARRSKRDNETEQEYFERTKDKLWATKGTTKENQALQIILNNAFKSSGMQWFNLNLVKDVRNDLIYPSKGYRLMFTNKLALPGINKDYAFFKTELEGSWYTSLIGKDKLVLMLHGMLGTVFTIGQQKNIPYKELYHMGGQGSVRGFKFGEVGPAWKDRDPLGAKHALLFNAELIFPLIPDYSMKAHVFYDAGAGWDTPTRGTTMPQLITRNKFDLRQSVGFGFNMMRPQPIKVDWGYKIDRRPGESTHELHLSANWAF